MLKNKFLSKYETNVSELKIGDKDFRFFVPRTIDRFINSKKLMNKFPLWARIWEASFILADYVARMPLEPEKSFLEIGGGMGIVSIVAASFGHDITMTEYDKNALNFAKANAELNLSSASQNLKIMDLDWHKPEIDRQFDYIIGSEVIYKEESFTSLLKLFMKYLKPGGEVILSETVRKTSMEFFKQAGKFFDIRAQKKRLRTEDEETVIILAIMKMKDQP